MFSRIELLILKGALTNSIRETELLTWSQETDLDTKAYRGLLKQERETLATLNNALKQDT